MSASFKINNPDKVEFELRLSMELSDWVKFKDQLNTTNYPQSYPTWTVLNQISGMIVQASAKFLPEVPSLTEND